MGAGASSGAPFATAEAALAAGKTQEEIDVYLKTQEATTEVPTGADAAAAAAAAAGVDPMALLTQLQGVLAQPEGLAKVLQHATVIAARKTTPVVEEFCTAVEAAGPMAALGFLGRPEAMAALTSVLPDVIADINSKKDSGSSAEVDDIYD